MPAIEIGYDKWGNAVTIFENYGYGVMHCIAKSRYGKTILIKNMIVQIAKYRFIVVFDYKGEHSDMRWGNWRSKDDICFIPDLHTITGFAFYMNDFNQASDWSSMGISLNGVALLMRLLTEEDMHQNDPLEMIKIIDSLPVSENDIEDFVAEYPGYEDLGVQNYSVRLSLASKFKSIWRTRLIIPPIGTPNHKKHAPDLIHIDDWAELIRDNPHLNINLAMFSSGGVAIARASAGKILEALLPYLRELKPVIVIEEAGLICPAENPDDDITSRSMLKDYVVREQRTGVKLIFIMQQADQIDQEVLEAGMTWVFGIHKANATTKSALDMYNLNYERDIVAKLRRDDEKGWRDFAIIDIGKGGKYQIFTPKDSSTRLPKSLKLRSRFLAENRREGTGMLKKLMFNEVK